MELKNISINEFQLVTSASDAYILLSLGDGQGGRIAAGTFTEQIKPSIQNGVWFIGSQSTGVTAQGEDGKSVRLRQGSTGIEWAYVDEENWKVVVPYSELKLDFDDLTEEQKAQLKMTLDDLSAEDIALLQQPARDMIATLESTNTQMQAAKSDAQDTADHPTYIGIDYYVYKWNKSTKVYDKTSIYVKGEQGEQGVQGEQGEQGVQGEQGQKGEDGLPPTLQLGDVTTLEAGANASAKITPNGTTADGSPIYKIDLFLPRGAKGENGSGSGNVLVDASKLVKGRQYVFTPNENGSAEGRFEESYIPDEEDITSVNNRLKLKDRTSDNGMGYVILRKDKTLAEQMTKTNTIYEIRYDFDLDGKEVAIPIGCTLKFEGGKISNGKILCENCSVIASPYLIFDNIILDGGVKTDMAYVEWFGDFNHACKYFEVIQLLNKEYQVEKVVIENNYKVCEIKGLGVQYSTITCNENGISLEKYVEIHDVQIQSTINGTARNEGVGVLMYEGYIHDTAIYAFRRGIDIDKDKISVNVRIIDNNITYCREYGVCSIAEHAKNAIQIKGNYIIGIGSTTYSPNTIDSVKVKTETGIYIDGGLSLDVSNNIVEYCNGSGIYISSDAGTLEGIVVNGNYFENNKYCGCFFNKGNYPISKLSVSANRGYIQNQYIQEASTREGNVYYNINYDGLNDSFASDDVSYERLFKNKDISNLFPIDTFVNYTYSSLRKWTGNEGLRVQSDDMPHELDKVRFKLSEGTYVAEFKVSKNIDAANGHRIALYGLSTSGVVNGIAASYLNAEETSYVRFDVKREKMLEWFYFAFTGSNAGTLYLESIKIIKMSNISVLDKYGISSLDESVDGSVFIHKGKQVFRYNEKWYTVESDEYGTNKFGETSLRPSYPRQGFMYFDLTINKPIWWNGESWVDATGNGV